MDSWERIRSSSMPRMGNSLTRWIGRTLYALIGWEIEGQLPDEDKVVLIGAPHTSNWDLIIAMGAAMAAGLRFSWMMKKEAFVWPLGPLWRALGGIPIDRASKNSMTQQMAANYAKADKLWLGITPEGTRSKVDTFKKGYLRIAYAANVPVFLIGIDGIRKRVILDRIWPLTGEIDADNEAIKSYFDATYVGVRQT